MRLAIFSAPIGPSVAFAASWKNATLCTVEIERPVQQYLRKIAMHTMGLIRLCPCRRQFF